MPLSVHLSRHESVLVDDDPSKFAGLLLILGGPLIVGSIDLAILLGGWSIPDGAPGCGGAVPCVPDVTGDGVVDSFDLAILLGNWNQP